MEAALLVARTAAHRVNNALAPLAGYADVLAQHPAIQADPRLARYVTAALAGAKQAAAEIARLQRIVRLEEDTTISLEPPILDLDRSTASESGATEAPGEPDSGGP